MMNQIAQDVVAQHATAFFLNRYATQLDQSRHGWIASPAESQLEPAEIAGQAILY